MPQENLKPVLESLLFVAGAPQSLKKLAKVMKISPEEMRVLADSLADDYKNGGRGLRLFRKDDEAQLVTAPECSQWVAEMTKLDFEEDLSRAPLEALAIVAYRAPISRARIEAIRGVDSTYTLRTLLLRGLIERYENPVDQRSYLYRPTFDLFRHLGIEKNENLPDFSELSKKLEKIETEAAAQNAAEKPPEQNPETEKSEEIAENPAAGAV